jgi:hypothetical protein
MTARPCACIVREPGDTHSPSGVYSGAGRRPGGARTIYVRVPLKSDCFYATSASAAIRWHIAIHLCVCVRVCVRVCVCVFVSVCVI